MRFHLPADSSISHAQLERLVAAVEAELTSSPA